MSSEELNRLIDAQREAQEAYLRGEIKLTAQNSTKCRPRFDALDIVVYLGFVVGIIWAVLALTGRI